MRKYKLSRRTLSYIVAVAIVLISLVNQLIQSSKPTQIIQNSVTPSTSLSTSSAQLIKVIKVLDGDTIKIETGQTVRYIGIDTPELHHPKKKLECFGREARDKNKDLVEGKLVRLEKDVSETDRYWRLLRYVYVITEASPSVNPSTSSEQLFVNDYLVREGYAYSSTFPPDVKYADHFRELEKEARENKRGLWSKCS